MTKKCSTCFLTKPLDEFADRLSGKDGKRQQCKECTRKRRAAYYQAQKQCPEFMQKKREQGRLSYHRTKIHSVYAIIHKASSRRYIGSATHTRERFNYHHRRLRANTHCNQYLQHAWNKYGEDAFDFVLLETIDDPRKLVLLEQKWLDRYQTYSRTYGFNICPVAGSPLGRKLTKEHKEKIRRARKSRQLSEQTKHKISLAAKGNKRGLGKHNGKLTSSDVKAIKTRLATTSDTRDSIAKDFGVHPHTIYRIIRRECWWNVVLSDELEKQISARIATYAKRNRKNAKVTPEQVSEIKRRITSGETNVSIAQDYPIGPESVSGIKNGRRWADID